MDLIAYAVPFFLLALLVELIYGIAIKKNTYRLNDAISNLFTPYLLEIAEAGGFENAARYDKSLRKGMYFYHGILTNKTVAEWFDLPYRDINLIFI